RWRRRAPRPGSRPCASAKSAPPCAPMPRSPPGPRAGRCATSARSSGAESLALRHSLALVALLLAGCSVKGEQEQAASAEGSAAAAPETVSCALKGSDAFKDRCTIERSASDGRNFIVLRH